MERAIGVFNLEAGSHWIAADETTEVLQELAPLSYRLRSRFW